MTMKYVSTADLKAKLSQYLSEVREGQTIYVTSHHHPVAELIPVQKPEKLEIIEPTAPLSSLEKISGVSRGPLPAEEYLNEDRGRR